MKRLLFLFSIVTAISFFTACSSDDDETPIIKNDISTLRLDSVVVENESKCISLYDENGLCDSIIKYDFKNGEYFPSYLIRYKYDENNNLKIEIGSEWEEDENSWDPIYKHELFYNDGKPYSLIDCELVDDEVCSNVPNISTPKTGTFIYNEEVNYPSSLEIYYLDEETYLYKTEYTYDANKNLLMEVVYYENTPYLKQEFNYDTTISVKSILPGFSNSYYTTNKLLSGKAYSWNKDTNNWEEESLGIAYYSEKVK